MDQYRKRMRHPGFNYRSDGFYFVTSCIQDRLPLFGALTSSGMQLNEWGKIANQQWLWLEKQYPYVSLVSFVIMPDHTHALIHIQYDKDPASEIKKHSILELIGAYKTTSSKLIHLAGCKAFKWQRSHYLTVVFKQEQIDNIIRYIKDNPAKGYASRKNYR